MSVDFFIDGELRASLRDRVVARLASNELERKAGVRVDPCGTTVISPEHAGVWAKELSDLLPKLSGDAKTERACRTLIEVMTTASRRRQSVMVEGE